MVDNPSSSPQDLNEGSQKETDSPETDEADSSPPEPTPEPVEEQDSAEESTSEAITSAHEEELDADDETTGEEEPEQQEQEEEIEQQEPEPEEEEIEQQEPEPEEEEIEQQEPEPVAAVQQQADDETEEEEEEKEEKDDNKHWYVVKVQSGREESIKNAIEKRVKIEGLEEYFGEILIPTDKEKVKVKNQWKTREKKRFPGYIMAYVEYNDQILYLFRETSGVGDFVGGGINQQPQPMTAKEVDLMKGLAGDKKEKAAGAAGGEPSPYNLGDHVKIKEGLFKDLTGEVKEIMEDKAQIRVETTVMGRPVSVELEYWQVEEA